MGKKPILFTSHCSVLITVRRILATLSYTLFFRDKGLESECAVCKESLEMLSVNSRGLLVCLSGNDVIQSRIVVDTSPAPYSIRYSIWSHSERHGPALLWRDLD